MDLDEIKDLMAAMQEADIHKVSLKEKGFEIELMRGGIASAPQPAAVHYAEPVREIAPAPVASPKPGETQSASGNFITSPMVGTFYTAGSPDDPPFVKVGDTVSEDSVVSIIEAMKVMNEVKAGVSGVVTEILVKNGEPVEFGTKLFRVE